MAIRNKKRLGDMLISEKVVTSEQIDKALAVAKESDKKIGEVLVEMGYVTEEEIADVVAKQMSLKRVTLAGVSIPKDILGLVNGTILRKHMMIPYEYNEKNMNIIRVAMADPMDMIAIDDFSIITNLQVEAVAGTQRDILLALDKYYGDSETLEAARKYADERRNTQAVNQENDANRDELNNSPIVMIVKTMIEQAARQRASDIHIEALEKIVRVRYRIDGALYEKLTYDIELLPAIIARIKIIGEMDISEKRKPQDGRITMTIDRREYDIRVSILPTVYGEKCVMRLAQKTAFRKDKKELGFAPAEMSKFEHILKNPNGIILVTGPTGSGKSTTLYTALSELNRPDVNIITVEDPVEANVDGVNQVQVNTKADLTFASALRSILRQDPDIIMIGEIRDEETAQIAVQASITGHLVVSTLHTNSAAGSLTRLMDMGIESYLLADSMVGIIAQRLVRRLCPNCKKERDTTEEERIELGIDPHTPRKIYKHCGCERCDNTGFVGRIGVYEIMTITPKLAELISSKAPTEAIKEAAVEEGMSTIRQGAAKLVLDGVTSYGEMLSVSFEN